MSVPVYERGPWAFSVNNDCSEASIVPTCKHAAWQLKESLISFPAWSVVACSDGVSVKNIGDASPDLWIDWTTDILGGTGAHSWVVLENSVTGGQLCIDMNSTFFYYAYWLYSATGAFNTDGTTSARPTDSESTVIQTSQWMYSSSVGAIVNVMISDDEKSTRFYVHQRNGVLRGGFFVGIETLTNTPAEWIGTDHQAVFVVNINIGLSATPVQQSPEVGTYDSATAKAQMYQVDADPYEGWNTAFYTCEAYHQWNSGLGNGLNSVNIDLEWAGGYPVCPIGLFRNVATRGGSQGRFQDIYWGQPNHAVLDTYPASGAKTWIKVGCFMIPWNGTTPLDVP